MKPIVDEKPPSPVSTDLLTLACALRQRFAEDLPRGYLPGKTRLRNAVMDLARVSAVEAEALVDRMQEHGFVRYSGDPREVDTGRDSWSVHTPLPGVH